MNLTNLTDNIRGILDDVIVNSAELFYAIAQDWVYAEESDPWHVLSLLCWLKISTQHTKDAQVSALGKLV